MPSSSVTIWDRMPKVKILKLFSCFPCVLEIPHCVIYWKTFRILSDPGVLPSDKHS